MKTLEKHSTYENLTRTEERKEEYKLYEDLLLTAKAFEETAKVAYLLTKEETEPLKNKLEEYSEKLKEQIETLRGYIHD